MPLEEITGGLAIEGALASEDGPYERIVGGLAITYGRQVPLAEVWGGLSIEPYSVYTGGMRPITGGLAIGTQASVTHFVLQTITAGLAIESYPIQPPTRALPSQQRIAASTPVDTLPQTGSAIYTKWQSTQVKETRVHRHFDGHESSGLDDDDTQRRWDLAINVAREELATHWDFIIDHSVSGISFYFYDLQSNGFQYDGTGVLLDGRYTVRFDTNPMPQIVQVGYRCVIEYSLVEII